MRTKANKARNAARRGAGKPGHDPYFDTHVDAARRRMEEQANAQGGYDPDSFTHFFEQFGEEYSDNAMERETAEAMRPKFRGWMTPRDRRQGRRRRIARGNGG